MYSDYCKTFKMSSKCDVFVIMGASGDLSKKKIYPTLWFLYRQNFISQNTKFIGYARSSITVKDVRQFTEQYMQIKEEEMEAVNNFFENNYYLPGKYDDPNDFKALRTMIDTITGKKNSNIIFYLALPPTVFKEVSEMIRRECWPRERSTGYIDEVEFLSVFPDEMCAENAGWGRIIIEKPFGHDLVSSNELSKHISSLFHESEIYRIDHYLGKEMVKNLFVLRFGNILFRSLWDRNHIASVQITFKEDFGVEGRGGYFNDAGIIRDIIQNHLLQIMSLIAMEKPLTTNADDIRIEKLKALRAIKALTLDNLVVGQYIGNPASTDPKARLSYKDVKDVPSDSITPTYACAVLYVNNERWDNVPFILRCGKALNERKAEIRIQFKDVPGDIFSPGQLKRNELVIRVQPGEAIYIKMMTKTPGIPNEDGSSGDSQHFVNVEETELELTYIERYEKIRVPDAYENLILDVFNGLQMDFVHVNELKEAWRIVDSALKQLVQDKVKPYDYVFGSRNGPDKADELIQKQGVAYYGTYVYKKKSNV